MTNKISQAIEDAALLVYSLQGDDLEDGVDKTNGDKLEKELIDVTNQILEVIGEKPVKKEDDNGVLNKVAELNLWEPEFVERLIDDHEQLSSLLKQLVKMKNKVNDILD